MIVSSGVDEHVLFLNKKFTDLFGYTIEDIPDVSHWWPLAYPDARFRQEIQSLWSARIAKVDKEKGESEPLEATVTCKDGRQRYIQFRFSSIAEKTLVIFIDMTEFRRLSLQNEMVLNSAGEGIFGLDMEGRVTFVNPSAANMLGYRIEELLNRRSHEAFHYQRADGTPHPPEECSIYNAVAEGVPYRETEDVFWRKDATFIPVEYVVTPMLENNKTVGAVVSFIDITERKRVENALRENQERLDLAIRSADMGVWHWDIIENKRHFDDQACHLLGINPATFTGGAEEFFEAIHPDDRETIKAALALSMEHDVPYESEYRTVWPDGSVHYINARGSLVCDDKGRPHRINGIIWDMTERKQAEQALHASEEGFREAQRLAQIGSWDWDATTDAIYWSDEYYRIYGLEIGSPPIGYVEHLKAYTPESIERLDAAVKKAMEDGTPYVLDLELAKPSATTRWVSARGEATRDSDGKIVGLRGTAQNITYRRQSEETVRQSEAEYRTLFEDSKDTVIMTSPEGEILDINAAGVQLLGYGSREELLQVNIAQTVYTQPEDRKQMLNNLQRQGYLKNYDLDFLTKDGKKLYLSASLTSMLNDDGEIVAIRGILHDMTEHRRLEEQLRQSQKLESIGMLAGGVAHDFNNYLTAIEGYTDLAMMELSEDSPAYKELQEARRSSDRAAILARQLLLFSRREPMHPKLVSLNVIITDLIKMLGRLIGEQYRTVTHLDEELWTINADTAHIEQVIMNLVVNARDAMPGGGEINIKTGNFPVSSVYVGAHPGSQPGEFVCLQIEDSGCGMNAEIISHIFEPFFTTKGAAQGTGLGLSVVYGIITQHRGWIDVESNPGRGTIFSIFLPALPIQAGIDEIENIPVQHLQGHGEKILLVEDEGVVRELAEKMLVRNGYSVTVTADAEEAAAVFKNQQGNFDLVFSDVILPKENGVTLVGRLLEEKPELGVLLASGYSDIGGLETIKDRGYPFLQKPYQLKALLKIIRELLDRTPSPS